MVTPDTIPCLQTLKPTPLIQARRMRHPDMISQSIVQESSTIPVDWIWIIHIGRSLYWPSGGQVIGSRPNSRATLFNLQWQGRLLPVCNGIAVLYKPVANISNARRSALRHASAIQVFVSDVAPHWHPAYFTLQSLLGKHACNEAAW